MTELLTRPVETQSTQALLNPEKDPDMEQILGQLSGFMDQLEAGAENPAVANFLQEVASNVNVVETHSGGYTIPGTDEWIPGSAEKRYQLKTETADGQSSTVNITPEFGERLLGYKAAPTEEPGTKTEEPEAKTADIEPDQAAIENTADTTQTQAFDRAENARRTAKNLAALEASMKAAGFEFDGPQKAVATPVQEPAKPRDLSIAADEETLPPVYQPKHRKDVSVGLADAFVDGTEGSAKHAAEPKHRKQKNASALEISDLATVDEHGVARVTMADGSTRKLSKHGEQQFLAHEEQIRKGLAKLLESRGLIRVNARGRAVRPDGKFMSNKELAAFADSHRVADYLKPLRDMDENRRTEVLANMAQATREHQRNHRTRRARVASRVGSVLRKYSR